MAYSYLSYSAVFLTVDVLLWFLYSELLFCMRNVRAFSLIPDPGSSQFAQNVYLQNSLFFENYHFAPKFPEQKRLSELQVPNTLVQPATNSNRA